MKEELIKYDAEMEPLQYPHPPTNELLDTYDDNYHSIESAALDLLAASEISVFNGLRNLSSQGCLKALDRIGSKYVSDGDFVDYFVSLAVMTEYICTAYRNPHLYDTFLVALGSKFTDMLFGKLCQRWMQVYRNHNLSNYVNSAQFEACFNILKYSVSRFPKSFALKYKLHDIICTGEEILHLFEHQNLSVDHWSTPVDHNSPFNETKKLTQPCTNLHNFTTAKNAGMTTFTMNHETKIPTRSPETNLLQKKTKGWMYERGVGQLSESSKGMKTTSFEIKLPATNHETSAPISKPEIKPKSKGWIFEREVLQSPVTNAEKTTVMIKNSERKNLQTKTWTSTSVTEKKKKSKGWMFEREVLQAPSRSTEQLVPKVSTSAEKQPSMVSKPVINLTETVSKVTAQCHKKSHIAIPGNTESVLIETIDLTGSEWSALSKTCGAQNSIDIPINLELKLTDAANMNGSVGSLEPPKKKIRNAFDVLMRRDKKKMISGTSVQVV